MSDKDLSYDSLLSYALDEASKYSDRADQDEPDYIQAGLTYNTIFEGATPVIVDSENS